MVILVIVEKTHNEKKQIDAKKMKFTIRELVWFYDFVILGRFVKVDTLRNL